MMNGCVFSGPAPGAAGLARAAAVVRAAVAAAPAPGKNLKMTWYFCSKSFNNLLKLLNKQAEQDRCGDLKTRHLQKVTACCLINQVEGHTFV